MSAAAGDPASLAAFQGDLRRQAHALSQAAQSLEQAVSVLADSRPGRRGLDLRIACDRLAGSAHELSGILVRAADAISEHTEVLRTSVAATRRIVEGSNRFGLLVQGDQVTLPWGIRGAANPDQEHQVQDARAALADQLDAVQTALAASHATLIALLSDDLVVLSRRAEVIRAGR